MKLNTSIITLALAAALSATLTGCTTYDAYTGEEKASNTAKGAGIGAGAAAVISYIANKDKDPRERNKRILRDAGIGAIIGGGRRWCRLLHGPPGSGAQETTA